MTSSSGLPFSSWISSPGFRPIRSATDPGSTDSTRSFWPFSPRWAGASRYSCTAFFTYAEAENCFFVLLIGGPLTQGAHEIVDAGERCHESRHVKKNVQLGHNDVFPVEEQNRENRQDLHESAGLAVGRRREDAPAEHQDHDGRDEKDEDVPEDDEDHEPSRNDVHEFHLREREKDDRRNHQKLVGERVENRADGGF